MPGTIEISHLKLLISTNFSSATLDITPPGEGANLEIMPLQAILTNKRLKSTVGGF